MIAAVIARGDVVHVFGSGHSHMIAEEAFHRAGGLMAVDAMLDPKPGLYNDIRLLCDTPSSTGRSLTPHHPPLNPLAQPV